MYAQKWKFQYSNHHKYICIFSSPDNDKITKNHYVFIWMLKNGNSSPYTFVSS